MLVCQLIPRQVCICTCQACTDEHSTYKKTSAAVQTLQQATLPVDECASPDTVADCGRSGCPFAPVWLLVAVADCGRRGRVGEVGRLAVADSGLLELLLGG